MKKKSNIQRIILIVLIVILLGSAGLIAYKLNAKNPLDSSIANQNTKATFQKKVIIPNAVTSRPVPQTTSAVTPSVAPTAGLTAGPTQTLIAIGLTVTPTSFSGSAASTEMPTATPGVAVGGTEEVIVAESGASSSATITVEPTITETLLATGSYQYLFILALAGTSVIIMSLLF